ncbi:hypothetical protein GEMRC1_007132 [Eukaryota sp. GEM-RC1]
MVMTGIASFHPPSSKNDFFVTSNTNIKGALRRCISLFDKGFTSVKIHGLGLSVFKAVEIANQVKHTYHLPIKIDFSTHSLEVFDEQQVSVDTLPVVSSKQRSGVKLVLSTK